MGEKKTYSGMDSPFLPRKSAREVPEIASFAFMRRLQTCTKNGMDSRFPEIFPVDF
jgi:hypothetical protein